MIRLGIVGAGGIARRHVEEITSDDELTIAAVVDARAEQARSVAAQLGALAFTDVADMVEHVDAAYVLTPPRQRVAIIKLLADAGKPIFCEKPLAATVTDAREIAEVVTARGVPFMMGFMRRWHPPYLDLKTLINSGRLGRPLQLFRQRIGYLAPAFGNWRVDANERCGMTVESVSHDIDLLRWLAGHDEIVDVQGQILESSGELPGYDDNVVATMRFGSGLLGVLQVSWTSYVQRNQCGVIGTNGSALISGAGMWNSDELAVRWSTTAEEQRTTYPQTVAAEMGYPGETRAFRSLLRGESVEHPDVRDGLATVETSHRILAASADHAER